MYKSQSSSKSPKYYLTIAQQLHSNNHQFTSCTHLLSPPSIPQQPFTFSPHFYPQQNKSALPQYHPKHRSASLPSQCLVRTPSKNHFSFYDQLKRRDYIVGRGKYESMAQLKRDYGLGRKRSYESLGKVYLGSQGLRENSCANVVSYMPNNAELNRFSKTGTGDSKKLSKSTLANRNPLIKTNIKLYSKPDQNNKITQIHSIFKPYQLNSYNNNNNNHLSTQQPICNNQNPRQRQTPIMDCHIQVKSDDEGRYYSTVESQFPTVLNQHITYHDPKQNVFTTQAVMFRDYPNPFEGIRPLNYVLPNQAVGNHASTQNIHPNYRTFTDKDIQTEHQKKTKQYDTYIVRRKSSPTKTSQNYLSQKPQYNQYLQSMQNKPFTKQKQTLQFPGRIKRKIIIEYQMNSPKKQKSPTKPNSKRKSQPKTHAENLGLKYYYSKYYIAEQQNRQRNHNRSKSGSIRNYEKSQAKQKTKRSPSKNNTHQKSNKKLSSGHQLKTKEKTARPCHANYASTHLFTTKK